MESIKEIIEWSEIHGKEVGKKASKGCEISKRIIQFYSWHRESTNKCTFVLLDSAVSEWINNYGDKK